VIELRQHLGLALQARQPLGVFSPRLGQHRDRHLAVECAVAAAIDLAPGARSRESSSRWG